MFVLDQKLTKVGQAERSVDSSFISQKNAVKNLTKVYQFFFLQTFEMKNVWQRRLKTTTTTTTTFWKCTSQAFIKGKSLPSSAVSSRAHTFLHTSSPERETRGKKLQHCTTSSSDPVIVVGWRWLKALLLLEAASQDTLERVLCVWIAGVTLGMCVCSLALFSASILLWTRSNRLSLLLLLRTSWRSTQSTWSWASFHSDQPVWTHFVNAGGK